MLVAAPSIVKERQVNIAPPPPDLVTVCKLHQPSVGATCTFRILGEEAADPTQVSCR